MTIDELISILKEERDNCAKNLMDKGMGFSDALERAGRAPVKIAYGQGHYENVGEVKRRELTINRAGQTALALILFA